MNSIKNMKDFYSYCLRSHIYVMTTRNKIEFARQIVFTTLFYKYNFIRTPGSNLLKI